MGTASSRIFGESGRRIGLGLRWPVIGIVPGTEEPHGPVGNQSGPHQGEKQAASAVGRSVRTKHHGETGADEEWPEEHDHQESRKKRFRPAEDGAPEQPEARSRRRQQQEGIGGEPLHKALGDPA